MDAPDDGVARLAGELSGRARKVDASLVAASPPPARGLSRNILLVLGAIVVVTALVALWYAPSWSTRRIKSADSATVEAPRPQRPAFLDAPPKLLTMDSAQRQHFRMDSARAADSILRREEMDAPIDRTQRLSHRSRSYASWHPGERGDAAGDVLYRKALLARALLVAPAERHAVTERAIDQIDTMAPPYPGPPFNQPSSLAPAPALGPSVADGDRRERAVFLKRERELERDTVTQGGDSGSVLAAGTVISAALLGDVNSDLPGDLTAQVTRDVYDSRTERVLLIPKGSRLVGRYDDRVVVGQHRLLVAWTRLMFADGRSTALPGLQASDQQGASGIVGAVDQHIGQQFGDALLLSLLGAGVELSQPRAGVYGTPSVGGVAGAALGQQLSEVALELVRRHADVPPTISVPLGTRFNVYVSRDLVFRRSE